MNISGTLPDRGIATLHPYGDGYVEFSGIAINYSKTNLASPRNPSRIEREGDEGGKGNLESHVSRDFEILIARPIREKKQDGRKGKVARARETRDLFRNLGSRPFALSFASPTKHDSATLNLKTCVE